MRYQIELLHECLSSGIVFDRIFILTGQDYPLWSNKKIEDELRNNPQKEYIKGLDITPVTNPPKIRNKLVIYHFLRDLKLPYKLKKVFSFGSRLIMTALPIRKLPYIHVEGKKWDVWQASAYMCLTFSCAKYVYGQLCNNKRLIRYFKTSFAPDEMVIPTIIFNSEYKNNASVAFGGYKGLKYISAITYFNYDKAIQVFTEKDYNELKDCGMMFARKFESGKSDKLIEMIETAKRQG